MWGLSSSLTRRRLSRTCPEVTILWQIFLRMRRPLRLPTVGQWRSHSPSSCGRDPAQAQRRVDRACQSCWCLFESDLQSPSLACAREERNDCVQYAPSVELSTLCRRHHQNPRSGSQGVGPGTICETWRPLDQCRCQACFEVALASARLGSRSSPPELRAASPLETRFAKQGARL